MVYIELENGYERLMPAKTFWQCRKCEKIGGKLGFAVTPHTERFHFCPYCDEETQQRAVSA